MPILQADTEISTYADVVEQLLDLHEIGRDGGLNEKNAKRSIRSAYRDLPQKHPWSYYYRQRLMQTVASYSTGTIEYDHTGGANERQVTLTTGTWPTWAAFGRIIIDDVHYEIDSRVSGSIITLKEDSNPGADVAASTTYTIYRNTYPLPANFRRLGHLWDIDQQRMINVVEQQAQHDALVTVYDTPDTPWQATISGNSDYYSTMQLVFGPAPNAVISYDLLYEVHPRPLQIEHYNTGTIEISGTTVTLTNGVWPATCAGSILRVSGTDQPPTSSIGNNPFVSQHVIKSRTSSTVVVLEESGGTVAAGTGYEVSDPIDIESGSMLNAFLRMAEAEFCRAASRKDANQRFDLARLAILEAKENDVRAPRNNTPSIYDPFRRAGVTTDG